MRHSRLMILYLSLYLHDFVSDALITNVGIHNNDKAGESMKRQNMKLQQVLHTVAKVWLKANVQKSCQGEYLVDRTLTNRVIETCSKKHILDSLQHLHGEEEEDSSGQLEVAGSGVDPPSSEQPDQGEGQAHFPSEAHSLKG